MSENDLNWPSADVLIGYDSERNRIIYSKLSTGEALLVWDVEADRELTSERGKIIKPLSQVSQTPLLRRLLNRIAWWIRSL